MENTINYTPRAESALEIAADEAAKAGLGSVGTLDILLGLAQENEGLAVQALLLMGVTIEDVRKNVIALRGA